MAMAACIAERGLLTAPQHARGCMQEANATLEVMIIPVAKPPGRPMS